MNNIDLPNALPQDIIAKEKLIELVREKLIPKLDLYRDRFSDFPELQKKVSDETIEIMVESFAECFLLLNLTQEHIPDFFVFDEKFREEISMITNTVWILNSEDGPVFNINYDRLYEISQRISEKNSKLNLMEKDHLRQMIAHEVHHIYDIYFDPERAKISGIANARSDLAFLDPGENAAQQFGFRYRDLKKDEDDLKVNNKN